MSYQTDDAASCGFPVMIPNMYFETLMARKENTTILLNVIHVNLSWNVDVRK